MKAITINEFGSSSVLQPQEIPLPMITRDEVMIAVEASSVNPVDWKIRQGFAPALCPEFPAVLHPDCAGIVSEVGENVNSFAVGDEVYSFASGLAGKSGALAEFMPADARMVAKKPKSVSFAEAATLPLVAMTCWTALVDRTSIPEGASILIQGGTGGVGFLAVQIAKAKLGARVFATCGTDQKCLVAELLGAETAFNYNGTTAEDMYEAAPGGEGFDFIFNTAGAAAINGSVIAAKFGGTILDINGAFPTEGQFQFKALGLLSVFGGYPITHGFGQSRVGEVLTELSKLIDDGFVKPLLDGEPRPFSDVASAHDDLERGNRTGKIALVNNLSSLQV